MVYCVQNVRLFFHHYSIGITVTPANYIQIHENRHEIENHNECLCTMFIIRIKENILCQCRIHAATSKRCVKCTLIHE